MMKHALFFFLLASTAVAQEGVIEVGKENWGKPTLPNLAKPGKTVPVPEGKIIDIVILGDGYLAGERAEFETTVQKWYEGFLKLTPWLELRGAFRIRGVWTPSEGRATPERKSHYRLPSENYSVGDSDSKETREAIFAAMDRVKHNSYALRGMLMNTSVILLIRDGRKRNPSGLTRTIRSPDRKRAVRVGFGAYTHHEFGHSYGWLRDEYIRGEGSKNTRRAPATFSIHTVSNVSFTNKLPELPWAHLAPGSAANPDPKSVIGVLWIGGVAEIGAWHSEGTCMMNGTHENWNFAKTRRRAYLRDRSRYCFWCEEILVARTYARAGMLGDLADGEAVWKNWVRHFRPLYHKAFNVPGRILERNAFNAKKGWGEAKIFERPVP